MILFDILAAAGDTAPASSGSNTPVLIATLTAGAFGAVIAAMVTGLFTKRKLGAEATEIITKAAASVVTNLQGEVARQEHVNEMLVTAHRTEILDLIAKHDAALARVSRVLNLHMAWDAIAVAKLAEAGIEIEEPPTLTIMEA